MACAHEPEWRVLARAEEEVTNLVGDRSAQDPAEDELADEPWPLGERPIVESHGQAPSRSRAAGVSSRRSASLMPRLRQASPPGTGWLTRYDSPALKKRTWFGSATA